MKKFIFFAGLLSVFSIGLHAQSAFPAADKSPMDMSYYPANFPLMKIQDKVTGLPVARVIYSRPRKEGRLIFGGLVTYGDVWRLGANEATEIEFYQPVIIGDKKIPAGRYTLYAIVHENSWTFIVNRDNDSWGAFKYDAAKDVARVEVPAEPITDPVELLSMAFTGSGTSINLVVAWENIKVALPINF
jgi:hypothetical protein